MFCKAFICLQIVFVFFLLKGHLVKLTKGKSCRLKIHFFALHCLFEVITLALSRLSYLRNSMKQMPVEMARSNLALNFQANLKYHAVFL